MIITGCISPYVIPGILPPPVCSSSVYDLHNILRMASEFFSVSVEDVRGRKRRRNIIFARHAYCLAARTFTGKSTIAIGRVIGRHHATVLNSIEAASNMIDTGFGDFKNKFEYLKEALQ